jgi:radical SAM-linked protein
MARVRIRFAKLGKIRWTSHRDTARMWERAFRRARLPVGYTNGFSPRPRVSFGLALPTGHESMAEYLDVELTDSRPPDLLALPADLSAALPVGVDALTAAIVDEHEPSLQEAVTSCTWRLAVVPVAPSSLALSDLNRRVEQMLAADTVVVSRQRKGTEVTDDIRPAILSLRLDDAQDGSPGGFGLECELAAKPRSLRPSELVAGLGPDLEERQVRRMHQWIERDGARWEPLPAPAAATTAPHALERAL